MLRQGSAPRPAPKPAGLPWQPVAHPLCPSSPLAPQVYDIQLLVGGKSVAFSPDEYVAASLQIYLGKGRGAGG